MLKRKGIPAAVFVVTDLVGRRFWQVHDKLYHLVAKAFATWNDPRRELSALMRGLGLPTEPITREATRTPLLTVSALLPGLPIASVRRLMDGLEATVGNGFYDIPRTLDWPELARHAPRRDHDRLAYEEPRVAAGWNPQTSSPTSWRGRRQVLEARLGEPIAHFAYPGGQFNTRGRRRRRASRLPVRATPPASTATRATAR